MSLSTLLRAAAIVIAFIWGIFLVGGWVNYSEMLSYKGMFYDRQIEQTKNVLIIQSIVVAILFCGGIFSGSSSSKDEKETQAENDSNKSIQILKNEFIGEADLTNDAYKLFLVKKYAIEKNDALSKFVLNDRLFNSIDDALKFAADSEISEKLFKEAEKQKKVEYLHSPEYRKAGLIRKIATVLVVGICFGLIYLGVNLNNKKSQSKSSESFNSIFVEEIGKAYGEGYGITVGHNSQDSADKAANLLCQKNSASKKCVKLYGDEFKCAAFAYSPLNGYVAVGTANSLDLAKITAINLCNKNGENPNPMDCKIDNEKIGALCAN